MHVTTTRCSTHVTATTTLSGISGFSPSVLASWQPPKEYMMGKACTHSLMATGKDWLIERKTETTKAICVALTQQGIVVSRSSLSCYLWRLREPAKSQHALRTNGRPRLYYVPTWAALFLRRTDNVPKIIALLRWPMTRSLCGHSQAPQRLCSTVLRIVYFLHWLLINFLERMVLNSFRAMVGGRCATPPSFGGIGLSSLNSS